MSVGGRHTRLLVVWLLLAVLMGVIMVIERTDLVGPLPRRDGHIGSGSRALLPVPVAQLSAVEVVHAGRRHRFERDAAGAWFYHHVHSDDTGAQEQHHAEPAVAKRIADAFAAFGRTRIERQFVLEMQAKDYGVTTPGMLILVYRSNDMQPLAQYAVGDIAPDTLSRYVQVVGSSAVATIPNYQIDNLLTLIAEVASKSGQNRETCNSP